VDKLSSRILTVGGRLGYEMMATTPNTLIVYHDYQPAPLVYEVRGLPAAAGSKQMDKFKGIEIGISVECEGGSLLIPSYSGARAVDNAGKELKKFEGHSDILRIS